MVNLIKLKTLTLTAVGFVATQAHACPTAPDVAPEGPEASDRHPLVAGFSNPAGIALASTAGVVGLTRLGLRRSRSTGAIAAGTATATTAAFDYPGRDEW